VDEERGEVAHDRVTLRGSVQTVIAAPLLRGSALR